MSLNSDTSKLMNQAADMGKDVAEKALRATSDALEGAKDNVAYARTKAGEAIDALAERAHYYARTGMDKAHEAHDKARKGLRHAGDVTCNYVEEQPIKAIAIAAGVGAITAALLMLLRNRD